MAEQQEPWGWTCPFCMEFIQRKEWTEHVESCREAQSALATKPTKEKDVAKPEAYCSKTSGCYWKAGHDGDCETRSRFEREIDTEIKLKSQEEEIKRLKAEVHDHARALNMSREEVGRLEEEDEASRRIIQALDENEHAQDAEIKQLKAELHEGTAQAMILIARAGAAPIGMAAALKLAREALEYYTERTGIGMTNPGTKALAAIKAVQDA